MLSSYERMEGLICATLTPFSEDATKVNPAAIPTYARYLTRNGISGVFINGTTGEFHQMTCQERLQIQSAWLTPEIKQLFKYLIVHIGSPVWAELEELGRNARSLGATAVAVTLPSYKCLAPKTEEEIVQYLAGISAALPDLPLLLYNIEGSTPPHLHNNLHALISDASKRVNTLRGIKYTSGQLVDAYAIYKEPGAVDVALGCDEMVLPARAMGFRAFIGCTYNIYSDAFNQVLASVDGGRLGEARVLFDRLFDGTLAMGRTGNMVAVLKHRTSSLLAQQGGSPLGPTRSPCGTPAIQHIHFTQLVASMNDSDLLNSS